MSKAIENFRSEFFLDSPTHVPLNNAGISLLSRKCVAKLNELSLQYATEGAFIGPFIEEWAQSKLILAKFLNAKGKEVAWTPNCSSAISFVANGYEFLKGEEIVILENEYPSNFYPWVQRSKVMGSTLRIVKAEKDLSRSLEKVIQAINVNTRIVAVSHVQSDCGYLMDISALSEAASKVGAIVVVDVIQSMGVLPLDFKTLGADVLCGGSHKWICGPAGAGILVVKEELLSKIAPCLHGALNYGSFEDAPSLEKVPYADARKFEQGTVSFHSILGCATALSLLQEYSVDNLWIKAKSLRTLLENELKEMGFIVYGNPQATGPQISLTYPREKIQKFSEALHKERISHALRPAPVEEGKVLRFSPHSYNTSDEINFALKTLKKVLN